MKRLLIAFLMSFLLLGAVRGQENPPIPAPAHAQNGSDRHANDPLPRDQMEQMQKQQRAERQKQLKDDTTRLLELATQLKESVDKTNENVLSLEVVKRAEEIEKLAKHIKTNMRDENR